MTTLEARQKRREARKIKRQNEQLAERSDKENLIAAVRAYHLKCVEMHKTLTDVRDLLDGAREIAGESVIDISPAALVEIVAEIDALLSPAPRQVQAESIPAQVRLQATLDDMRDRGEFPPGTEAKAL